MAQKRKLDLDIRELNPKVCILHIIINFFFGMVTKALI